MPVNVPASRQEPSAALAAPGEFQFNAGQPEFRTAAIALDGGT
jgi:hypothetical protein